MLDLLIIPVALAYLVVIGSLFLFGLNFFYMTYLAIREARLRPQPPILKAWPTVTVQLPIYNERYVANRLIRAAAGLDYPRDRLEIQVLDDSTDDTASLVADQVARLRSQGLDIAHVRRSGRAGYKSGALAYGLERARGEFLAIFDADFLPPPDFLARTLPYFQDEKVGFVQARWGHLNREHSFLTLLQSLSIDAHFMVEQFARSRGGCWFNFNGTAGVWRRAAIQSAGGWRSDTLTEDLDLSYRAFLAGWRGLYLREVVVPAELPVSFSAYRRQQHRWARGSLECARKFLPLVWQARLPLRQKLQATFHLLGYGVHLMLCALVFLYPLLLTLSLRYPGVISLFGLAFLFNATAFAPTLFFVVAQQQLGWRGWQSLPAILFLSMLGAGMMLNTLRAALEALSRKQGVFERTPKFGFLPSRQAWRERRYQLRLDWLAFVEIAFALANGATAWFALATRNWAIAGYALLFCCGLSFSSGLSIAQSLALARHRAAPRQR